MAVLFIGLSLFGIFGVWFVDRTATDVVRKGYGLVETGVGVVDAGVGRVHDLVAASRTEVRQAGGDHHRCRRTGAGEQPRAQCAERSPGDPPVAAHRANAAGAGPGAGCAGAVGNAVSLVNSLPMMADRAPRLAALDETFNRLEGLSADATQMRSTLRALVVEQKDDFTAETVATLTGLTQRIDTRLGEVQANVEEVQADIDGAAGPHGGAQVGVLFALNLLALARDADAGLDRSTPRSSSSSTTGPAFTHPRSTRSRRRDPASTVG